jgi:hypothetical protein
MKSVIGTMASLGRAGIHHTFETADGHNVDVGRNILASRMLEGDWTHMFTADCDMQWHHGMCEKMLGQERDVIGVVYPRKIFDFQKMQAAIEAGIPATRAVNFALNWLVSLRAGQPTTITDGALSVGWIGLGVTLIRRGVFEKMIANGSARKQSIHGVTFHNFFTARTAGLACGEDVAFCQRWITDCGGEVHVNVGDVVFHHGNFPYAGDWLQYLRDASARGLGLDILDDRPDNKKPPA